MLNLEEMLNSSVHLGHQVKKWNPKMAPFIYGERNKVHIIDILQTLLCLQKACNFLYKSSKENKTCDYTNLVFRTQFIFLLVFFKISYFIHFIR